MEFIHDRIFSKEALSMALIEKSISTPLLCVAMEGKDTLVCQSVSKYEQHVFSAPSGELFVIKDFTVSKCSDETIKGMLQSMKSGAMEAELVANELIDTFHQRLRTYPLKCYGFGVTTVKNHSTSEVMTHFRI